MFDAGKVLSKAAIVFLVAAILSGAGAAGIVGVIIAIYVTAVIFNAAAGYRGANGTKPKTRRGKGRGP